MEMKIKNPQRIKRQKSSLAINTIVQSMCHAKGIFCTAFEYLAIKGFSLPKMPRMETQ